MENTSLPVIRQRTPVHAGEALASSAPPHPAPGPVRSLYIHVPFCFHKCHYCDFYSLVDTQGRQESFVSRLEAELDVLGPLAAAEPLESIFVGGGTPSLLEVSLWGRLLGRLRNRFDLSKIDGDDGEFTVECNPETVTTELMSTLAEGGVNRVSVGAQSFDRAHLKTLERWHDPVNVERALALAAEAGIRRRSLDLIFAVPGQSLKDWESDLDRAIALGTDHLSCYALTYEPRTALTARLSRGEVTRVDEDLETDMFRLTVERLRAAGFERYEVSNFARPGQECRHNLAYWRQDQWLAAGPSASAHVRGHRWKNVPRLDDYLGSPPGFSPIVDHEPPDERRSLSERVMTGLRLREGLHAPSVLSDAATLDPAAPDRLGRLKERLIRAGTLTTVGERWSLSDSGMLIADAIVVDFLLAIDGPRVAQRRAV